MLVAQQAHQIEVRCRIRVHADVKVEPNRLVQAFRAGESDPVDRELRVSYIGRAERASAIGARLERLPAYVSVLSTASVGEATEIEAGISQQRFRLIVRITPTREVLSRSLVDSALLIVSTTSGAELAQAQIPILLRRSSGIDAPREIQFGSTRRGDIRTRRLLLRSADERPFSILRISCSMEALIARASPGSAKQHWLEVVYRPRSAHHAVGSITVETDHPESDRIRIDTRSSVRDESGR
jgi:hypothetical protein